MNALARRQLFGRVIGMFGFGSPLLPQIVRRTAVVLALALPSVWMIIAGGVPDASAASAVDCTPSSNCFATYDNTNTSTNHGIYGVLYAHCLYVPNNGTFATNEIWDIDSTTYYWEEVGIYSGAGYQISYGNKNWFWADSRPGGGYNEHDSSVTASTDTSYRAKVEYEGNETWYIYGNGDYSYFGTSTSQSATLIEGQGGTEYTAGSTSGIRDIGNVSDLQRKSSSDTWYNWGNSAAPYTIGYITPSYDSTSSTVSWSGPC